MAVLMGGNVVSVSIEPPDDDGPKRYGETITQWPRMELVQQVTAEICVSLAGPVAEMLFEGEQQTISNVAEFAADWQRAMATAESATSGLGNAKTLLFDCQTRIEQLFDQPNAWAAVSAIADELLAHETLESDRVDEIVSYWMQR